MAEILAVTFPEVNRVELRDVPVPSPGPGEALVRVWSTTICATDMKILTGKFPGVRYPHIPGHEWSGEVVEVGPGVGDLAPGTRVGIEVHVGCGHCQRCLEGMYNLCEHYGNRSEGHAHVGFTIPGGLAEYAVVPRRAMHILPDGVSYDEGAFTDNVGIALWAVERAEIRPGERVLVIGPGAIGLLALRIASLQAGRTAIAGTRADRLALGLQMGADATVDVAKEGDAAAAVRQALGGPADVVIEFAGTADAAQLALAACRRGGRVVLGGSTGIGTTLQIELATIVRGNLDVRGSLANPRWVSRRGLELIRSGMVDVRPLITHHFPLREFEAAWSTFFERKGSAIRVMLHPSGGAV
ncbi:MAG: alcohol dehydrogenase catalytic domain-containing protein [Thermaerobacter sp.]|nr:alcohol dehydrogenase catalytic domain-containing protein [Thermaerobacter sp.]